MTSRIRIDLGLIFLSVTVMGCGCSHGARAPAVENQDGPKTMSTPKAGDPESTWVPNPARDALEAQARFPGFGRRP